MKEIIVMSERLLGMLICTTIPPERKDTINDRLKALGLNESGTRGGWFLAEDIEPVACDGYEGRWHYICKC